MIIFQKTTQAAGSVVKFNEDPASDIGSATARVSRTATLDGGAVIEHSGVVDGDRTFQIQASADEALETDLIDLFENETFLNIGTARGWFYGVISRLIARNGKIDMTVLVKE